MKKNNLFFSLLMAGLVLFASCGSDDDEPQISGSETPGGETQLPGDVKQYEYLNATSYTGWTYFSFAKGAIVEVQDYANDLSWDIAFHRGDLRLNGGASGKGQGEVVNTNQTNWNAVTVAPESGYVKDKTGAITTAFTGTGIETGEQPFSQTLSTWLTIDTSNPPPKYTYHNWVYVLKTAGGKYVKLQLYDYKDAKDAAGAYISFKYQYNSSGTNNFK